MKLAIRTHLPVLAVSVLHGRGEFFASVGARLDYGGFLQPESLFSSDPVFGVRVPCPTTLEPGARYLAELRFDPSRVEYVLFGDRTVWERMPLPSLLEAGFGGAEATMEGGRGKAVRLRLVAHEAEPMVSFVRDRSRCRWVEGLQGKWRMSLQAEDPRRHCSEWSEVDDELELPLGIDISLRRLPLGPEDVRSWKDYRLPAVLRFWRGPEIFHRMETAEAARSEPPEVGSVAYATDGIACCENSDFYEVNHEPERGPVVLEQLASHLDLCDRYGVSMFYVGDAWTLAAASQWRERLVELLRAGRGRSVRELVMTFGGPPVEQELDESVTRAACGVLRELLEKLPGRIAVPRIMEVNTNGQWPRPATIPTYLLWNRVYDKDLYQLENHLLPAELGSYVARIREWIGIPGRVKIWFQSDGPIVGPHWYEAGADLVTTKNIWYFNTNLVQAAGRGLARAFGRPIGLAYDSHSMLNYEAVNVPDIRHVYLSYYFAGVELTEYEAPFVGKDAQGIMRLTETGASYYRWVRWARRHPRRGPEVIRIGFLRGSDDYGLRNPGPGSTRHGGRRQFLLHGHPAYQDWNLLDLVYPAFGTSEGSNPNRFLTGTPFGQADIVPFNSPLAHLKTFSVLVMMGRNRMTSDLFESCIEFARAGGTLVLALDHLLAEDLNRRTYADLPLRELIGAELGDDVNVLPEAWDELVPSWTAFHNRVRPTRAEVVERFRNGDPLLLRHKIGSGVVWFHASEWLSAAGEDSPRRLLSRLFAEARLVNLTPPSDWIQVSVHARDGIVLVALINHGQAGFPQGHAPKRGAWKGAVQIQSEHLGRFPATFDAFLLDEEFRLHRLECSLRGSSIEVDVEVDELQEIVLGPQGETERALFRAD